MPWSNGFQFVGPPDTENHRLSHSKFPLKRSCNPMSGVATRHRLTISRWTLSSLAIALLSSPRAAARTALALITTRTSVRRPLASFDGSSYWCSVNSMEGALSMHICTAPAQREGRETRSICASLHQGLEPRHELQRVTQRLRDANRGFGDAHSRAIAVRHTRPGERQALLRRERM